MSDSAVSDAISLVLFHRRVRLFDSHPMSAATSPRSLLKPLQTAALLRMTRKTLTDEQVAIAASSHNGEPDHLERVVDLAEATGVDLAVLSVEPHRSLIAELGIDNKSEPPTREANPCVGKHILAAHCAQSTGADYMDPDGPVERNCRRYIRQSCRIGRELTPTPDGCGFPTYALTDSELATGLCSLLLSEDFYDKKVVKSLANHPYLVGGRGRVVTDVVLTGDALFAKDGVGGRFAVAYPNGVVAVGRSARDDQESLASALHEAQSLARRYAS